MWRLTLSSQKDWWRFIWLVSESGRQRGDQFMAMRSCCYLFLFYSLALLSPIGITPLSLSLPLSSYLVSLWFFFIIIILIHLNDWIDNLIGSKWFHFGFIFFAVSGKKSADVTELQIGVKVSIFAKCLLLLSNICLHDDCLHF